MVEHLTRYGQSSIKRVLAPVGAAACLSLLVATLGCSASGNGDIEKAEIAVRANPALELVATDQRQGVLTVKVRRSGQILTVKVGDIVSGVAFRDLESSSGPADIQASSTGSGGGANRSSKQQVDITGPAGKLSVARTGNGVSVGSGNAGVTAGVGGAASEAREGNAGAERSQPTARQGVDVSGPGGQVSVRSSGNGISVATPDGRQVTLGANGSLLEVQTTDSRRRDSGSTSERRAPVASSAPSSDGAGRGAVLDESRLERRGRSVVCKGANSEQLDGVLLRADDIAVESIGDCVVTIRDSHIIGRVGVRAFGSTRVSIVNSIIEGGVALSIEGAANVSVQSSTIRGQVRKFGEARLQDLGGNLWQ